MVRGKSINTKKRGDNNKFNQYVVMIKFLVKHPNLWRSELLKFFFLRQVFLKSSRLLVYLKNLNYFRYKYLKNITQNYKDKAKLIWILYYVSQTRPSSSTSAGEFSWG